VSDHDVSDEDGGEAVEEEPTPLQRVLDLLVFAPVGVALTVVEDLPGLIGKGRQRFETDVQNARVIGHFVVTHGQREVVERVGKLLHREAADSGGDGANDVENDVANHETDRATTAAVTPLTGAAVAPPARPSSTPSARPSSTPSARPSSTPSAPNPKPNADPADVAIVEGALAGYDTLSASQVVRRLESLGPDELEAIHRHEASHRNRRTILNRAHQILEAKAAGTDAAAGPETDRPAE
jgi:hypothetical protein